MRVFEKKRGIIQIFVMGCLLPLLFSFPSFATEASLADIAVTSTKDHLQIYFHVENCFTEEMRKAIDSGIKTTFNFLIRVYKVRDFWWDKRISETKVSHHVSYDNLKNVYIVTLPGRDNKEIFVRNFDEVKDLMSKIEGLRITEIQKLHKDELYQVRLMAELDKVTLPLRLHNVLFFLSLWDFKTDWHTLDFTY